MKDEIHNFKYNFLKNIDLSLCDNKDELLLVISNMDYNKTVEDCSANRVDSPDAYCINHKKLFIMEHFVIDSHERFNNGSNASVNSQRIADLNKASDLFFKDGKNETFVFPFEVKTSKTRLLGELIHYCEKHYKKEVYANNTASKHSIGTIDGVVFGLLIENTDFMPIEIVDGGTSFIPLFTKEFREFWKEHQDIDFIIYGYKRIKHNNQVLREGELASIFVPKAFILNNDFDSINDIDVIETNQSVPVFEERK